MFACRAIHLHADDRCEAHFCHWQGRLPLSTKRYIDLTDLGRALASRFRPIRTRARLVHELKPI